MTENAEKFLFLREREARASLLIQEPSFVRGDDRPDEQLEQNRGEK